MKKIINYKLEKILLFSFLFLICFNYLSFVNAKTYRIGTTLEKNIKFSKSLILPLSDGKWEVVDRFVDSYAFIHGKETWIVRLENKEIMEMILVAKLILSGTNMGEIDSAVNEIIFKDKYDGCYDRPEYYVFEHYSKGTSFNCLTIRHIDTQRELYNPDDPDTRITTSIRKYLRDNPSVKFPPIMLRSMHSYYSRLVGGNWYEVSYSADPKNFNSPQITKFSEETSEFHKYNISNYPKHKKTMDLWVSISANRHQEFERMSRSKKRHLLNLNKYNPINYDNKNQNKVIKKDIFVF